MDFTTDMNHRERAAVLIDLGAHIEAANRLVIALETANDTTLILETVIGSFTWSAVTAKLRPVIEEALEASKAQVEIDKFRGFDGH